MTESKKISFGFSKLSKKPSSFVKPQDKKVELIDCLEGQSIKIKDVVEEEFKPLVIPMGNSGLDVLARVREVNNLKERIILKQNTEIDERPDSELTLDELAARQLIKEATQTTTSTSTVKVHTLPIEDLLHLESGAPESTADDYENVPIEDYGLAMLRGMGWSENSGIGKRNRSAAVAAPELRPKGMGLGADKMIKVEKSQKPAVDKDGNELKLVKGAYAKIIAGKEKGQFCIVQGLDDEAGRVIVKTALKSNVLSLNEFMLMVVTNDEYHKSSKVLNNAKYEEYIKNEVKAEPKEKPLQAKNSNHNHYKIKDEKESENNSANYKSRSSSYKNNDVYEISSDSDKEEEENQSKIHNSRKKNKKDIEEKKERYDSSSSEDDSNDFHRSSKKNKKKSKSKKESRNRSRSPYRKKKSNRKNRGSSSETSSPSRRNRSKSGKNYRDSSDDSQSPSQQKSSKSNKRYEEDSSEDSKSSKRNRSKSNKTHHKDSRKESPSPSRRKSSKSTKYKNDDSSDDNGRGRSKTYNGGNKNKGSYKRSNKYNSSSEDDKNSSKYNSIRESNRNRSLNYRDNR